MILYLFLIIFIIFTMITGIIGFLSICEVNRKELYKKLFIYMIIMVFVVTFQILANLHKSRTKNLPNKTHSTRITKNN